MANKKITQLDALTSAAATEGDVLPIVDLDADQTKKIQLGDLKSGSFVGTSTGLAGSPSITVTNVNAASGAYILNNNGTISMATASIGGGIFTSASLAAGSGGGGGSAFPFTGSAEITGSINLIGPITSSGEISGSTSIQTDRLLADTYVDTPQIQKITGIELLANSGPITITGSGAVGIKTTDASTGGVNINSAKDFTNSALGKYTLDVGASGAGAYQLNVQSGGIRISASSGGQDPIQLHAGDEDGIVIGAGALGIDTTSQGTIITTGSGVITKSTERIWLNQAGSGGIKITGSDSSIEGIHMFPGAEAPIILQSGIGEIKLASGNNITQTATLGQIGLTSTNYFNNSSNNQTYYAAGNMEITASGLVGLRVSSSRFNLEGAGNSEIRVGGGSLGIQGSDTGDVNIGTGFARTMNLSSEGGTIQSQADFIKLNDNTLAEQFHISASGMHIISETQFFQFVNNLPTTEPTISGQLWASGSGYGSASGSKYIMVKQ